MLSHKFETLIHHPLKAIHKYLFLAKCKSLGIIPPSTGEDYDEHWGCTSFNGKTILDLGADYGSTAYYFLAFGANKVVAVEGNPQLFSKLERNYGKNPNVVCIKKWINSSRDIEDLIRSYKPDIIKIDIEGDEKHLVNLAKGLIQSVREWLIEIHSTELLNELETLFSLLGYRINVHFMPPNSVVYARR